jgi:hypothetical protein
MPGRKPDYDFLKKETQRLTQENSQLKDKIIQLMEEVIKKNNAEEAAAHK